MTRLVRFASLALALAAPLSTRAAAVELGFSARLADSGMPVSGNRTFAVRLFDVSTGGVPLWSETHASVEVLGGVAHLVLGSATPLDDALLNGAPLYVELAVDATTLSPRLEVLPGAYAIHATKAGSALTCSTADTANTLGGLAPAEFQRRVAASCPAGSSIRSIDDAGAIGCELDDLGAYAAGFGLSLTGNTFAVDGSLFARTDGAAGSQSFDAGTFYIDATNDRVGVLNSSPATALDVIGTASATDFAYRTPRPGTYWLPPSAFQSVGGGAIGHGLDRIYPLSSVQVILRAPLHLPEGVTLTGLTCEVYDNDGSNDFIGGASGAWVGQRPFGSTSYYSWLNAPLGTSGAADAIQTKSSAAGSVLVTSGADWFVSASMQGDPGASSNLRFYGCRVSYTSPGPR
jgi:hypothetical protein